MTNPQTAILFVCLGNICRSPLAEGVFRAVVTERGSEADFHIDSAGTGGWHAGSAPDPRSIAVAARHGVAIEAQHARKVKPEDFDRFDVILGMDRSNVDELQALAGPQAGKVHLFMEHALGTRRDVPDPYYGGPDGFEAVYRMIREASEALAEKLARASAAPSGQASSTM
jgi:protein-tyrosine phosphatase